jgi:hypothetical protein
MDAEEHVPDDPAAERGGHPQHDNPESVQFGPHTTQGAGGRENGDTNQVEHYQQHGV